MNSLINTPSTQFWCAASSLRHHSSPLSVWSMCPISALFRDIITHLVHRTVLHPPGGRCCFWLAADRMRTGSSRHAMSVWGHLSPPTCKCKQCGWLEASHSSLGALVSVGVCVGHKSWKVRSTLPEGGEDTVAFGLCLLGHYSKHYCTCNSSTKITNFYYQSLFDQNE